MATLWPVQVVVAVGCWAVRRWRRWQVLSLPWIETEKVRWKTRRENTRRKHNETAWILQLSSLENDFCLFFYKSNLVVFQLTIKPSKPSKPPPRGKLLTTHPNWRCGAAASVAWCDRFRPGSCWSTHLFLAWCHGHWKAGGWDYRKPWISLEVVVIYGSKVGFSSVNW